MLLGKDFLNGPRTYNSIYLHIRSHLLHLRAAIYGQSLSIQISIPHYQIATEKL